MTGPDKNPESHLRSARANRLFAALVVICFVLLLGDFFYHKEGLVEAENIPGFYGWYALLAGLVLIFAARLVRYLFQRREDYYD